MTTTAQLIDLLREQIQQQKEQFEHQKELSAQQQDYQEKQLKQQREYMEAQMAQQREESLQMIKALTESTEKKASGVATHFTAFDPNTELWTSYYARYQTFVGANSIPEDKMAQIFLTNQSTAIYKQISDWGNQQTPKLDINGITMDAIYNYMMTQYNPRTFIVRERYRFWSDMKRKPGETIQELAARIRHDATTCDFSSIKDPQDEALRTRFICSVGNEAVLKALYKLADGQVTCE